jgi:hypothetical protein
LCRQDSDSIAAKLSSVALLSQLFQFCKLDGVGHGSKGTRSGIGTICLFLSKAGVCERAKSDQSAWCREKQTADRIGQLSAITLLSKTSLTRDFPKGCYLFARDTACSIRSSVPGLVQAGYPPVFRLPSVPGCVKVRLLRKPSRHKACDGFWEMTSEVRSLMTAVRLSDCSRRISGFFIDIQIFLSGHSRWRRVLRHRPCLASSPTSGSMGTLSKLARRFHRFRHEPGAA